MLSLFQYLHQHGNSLTSEMPKQVYTSTLRYCQRFNTRETCQKLLYYFHLAD